MTSNEINEIINTLNQQLNNDDIKLSTMLNIIEALHCDIDITITDRATKVEYKL